MARNQLIAFTAVTVLGIGYVGARYAGLADAIAPSGYRVTVHLPETGGVYEGSEVTYRGTDVGKVAALRLTADGVDADLQLDHGSRVPADTLAVVADRSAVGEPYLDLQPRSSGGPYLHAGSAIARVDTRTPLPPETLITSLDRLAGSVPPDQLRITVDELGKAFAGEGPRLRQLIDSGDRLIDSAQANLPQTIGLLRQARTVLTTQADSGSAILGFSRDLDRLTATVKAGDGDLRKILQQGPVAAEQLNGLLQQVRSAVPMMLANLLTGSRITTAHVAGIRQLLVLVPLAAAAADSVLTPDLSIRLGVELNSESPAPCTTGYQGTRWRSPADTAPRTPNTAARCTAAPSSGTDVRGAQNAPKETDQTAAPTGSVELGSTGGQQNLFGKDSWKWLLVGPTSA
ncbi:MlaD family protein [Phaeacidiphilus oryzae]|uniref:MlaD family protein n=1 Tax=Phaeacidiphilus oryzae TaxID=348818 RepID=UPI002AFFB15D|nr:MlaD family protein [Phaeacidiphilus oryzae]